MINKDLAIISKLKKQEIAATLKSPGCYQLHLSVGNVMLYSSKKKEKKEECMYCGNTGMVWGGQYNVPCKTLNECSLSKS